MYRVIVAYDHTQRHTNILGRNPLDEGSARRKDLYLTTHISHKSKISVNTGGIQTAAEPRLRPHSHLDRRKSKITLGDNVKMF